MHESSPSGFPIGIVARCQHAAAVIREGLGMPFCAITLADGTAAWSVATDGPTVSPQAVEALLELPALRRARLFITNDLAEDPSLVGHGAPTLRALALRRFGARGQPGAGLLLVGDPAPREFTPGQQRLIAELSHWLEALVAWPESKELNERLRTEMTARAFAQERLEERLQRLELVERVSLGVSSGLDTPSLLRHAVWELARAWPDLRVSCYQVHADRSLHVVASRQPEGRADLTGRVLPRAPAAEVFSRQHPTRIEDVRRDPHTAPDRPLLASLGIQALLLAPVEEVEGEATFLAFDAPEPRPWSTDAIEVLVQVAARLQPALRAAQAEAATQAALGRLELANTRLATVIAGLPHGVLLEDETRHVLVVNDAFRRVWRLPLSPTALVGVDCAQVVQESAALTAEPARFLARIDELLAGQRSVAHDLVPLADGRVLARSYVSVRHEGAQLGHLWHYDEQSA